MLRPKLTDEQRQQLFDLVASPTSSNLIRYIEEGIPPGGFLTAVLSNDLTKAARAADGSNRLQLGALALWIWSHAPMESYGSPEKYAAWIARNYDLPQLR